MNGLARRCHRYYLRRWSTLRYDIGPRRVAFAAGSGDDERTEERWIAVGADAHSFRAGVRLGLRVHISGNGRLPFCSSHSM